MSFRKILAYIIIVFSLLVLSCGIPMMDDYPISGRVDLSGAGSVSGPVFVIVAGTDELDKLESDPMNSVISIITVGDDGKFLIYSSEIGLKGSDSICLVAFVDNDYTGGIPNPTEGDFIGFFADEEGFQRVFTVSGIQTRDIGIVINREIFKYSAEISGVINDDETGNITVIAYSGAIDSLDFSGINTDDIIAYKQISKGPGPADYTLDIMPYGKNIPIDNVYIIAFLDRNDNGIPDGGDKIGFYMDDEKNIPQTITVNGDSITGIDITMEMEIDEPSGYDMNIQGSFISPQDYDETSSVFILITDADTPENLLNDPVSAIKAFRKIPFGQNSFDIDLSTTSLIPGDDVMIIALLDNDYSGGFPDPAAGDMIGYYQWVKKNWLNTYVEDFKISLQLSEGINEVSPGLSENGGTWSFNINKNIYDYETSIRFRLDPDRSGLDSPIPDEESGDMLIAVVIHETGVNDGLFGAYQILDVDYVLAMSAITYRDDPDFIYSLNILNAIIDNEDIDPEDPMPVYMLLLFDRDKDGVPSTGDDIAAYWKHHWLKGDVPKILNIVSDEVNDLSGDMHNVKFIGQTY